MNFEVIGVGGFDGRLLQTWKFDIHFTRAIAEKKGAWLGYTYFVLIRYIRELQQKVLAPINRNSMKTTDRLFVEIEIKISERVMLLPRHVNGISRRVDIRSENSPEIDLRP